jgi:hypothetical protein
MEGGLPAGISTLPGLSGCLKSNTKIKITTRSGKKSTTSKGTLMVFSRILLRIRALILNCLARCDTWLKDGYEEGKEGGCTLMLLRIRDRNPISGSLCSGGDA